MAIGARSQSARTYLEKHLDDFLESDLEQLVLHGLRALRDTLPNEVNLNNKVRIWHTWRVCYDEKRVTDDARFGVLECLSCYRGQKPPLRNFRG